VLRPKNNYFLLLQKSSIARSIDRSIDRHIKESFFQFFNFSIFFCKNFRCFLRSKTSPTSNVERLFSKKKKNLFDKNSSLNHGDASWEEKGRAFFGRRQIRRREKERKKERKKERRGERGAFGSFFFSRRGRSKRERV
jgi:hypothetical protein